MLPKLIVKYILNQYLSIEGGYKDDYKTRNIKFYLYVIKQISLVSKEFKSLVNELHYECVDLTDESTLDIIIKLSYRGILFECVKQQIPKKKVTSTIIEKFSHLIYIYNHESLHNSSSIDSTSTSSSLQDQQEIIKSLFIQNSLMFNPLKIRYSKTFKTSSLHVGRIDPVKMFSEINNLALIKGSIETLKINDFSMETSVAQNIISNHKEIRQLKFRTTQNRKMEIKKLDITVLVSTNIKLLNIISTSALIRSFQGILDNLPNLETLEIRGHYTNCKVQLDDLSTVMVALSSNKSLTSVHINLNNNSSYSPLQVKVQDFVSLLNKNKTIKHLTISAHIVDSQENSPQEYGIYNNTLITLDQSYHRWFTLWRCTSVIESIHTNILHITPPLIRSIIDYHKNVTNLKLCFNSKETSMIIELLSSDLPHLTYLGLSKETYPDIDEFPDDFKESLLSCLPKFKNLRTLTMSDLYKSQFVIGFLELQNHSITDLEINMNRYNHDSTNLIYEMVMKHPTLRSFTGVDSLPFTSSLETFFKILNYNSTLVSLYIDNFDKSLVSFETEILAKKIKEYYFSHPNPLCVTKFSFYSKIGITIDNNEIWEYI
ncbi:hypothetical protein DLAC_00127 [Tieghemostelium lacteum]|uniref:Uncharacterized protein n=1 Tax=Tieghemostelium lacteum TaxID=361077 RepID=A0A152A966_TIELA|nr:hypothetical protein DLAC_00127 [Tieghemostelium lacteum]|eukprot:KYR02671.1 hypothetical protein DLAC_00127 [Tieghemostelium lacteum]